MHTDHRQPPLRALGVLVLFVAITLLAMRTGLAAPQAQVEEPSITPTPGIEPAPTPTPVEPIISPLPTSTPEPDFRSVSLDLTLDPPVASWGDVVTITWQINGYSGPWDGMELWISAPDQIFPVDREEDADNLEQDAVDDNWESNAVIITLSEARGEMSWYISPSAAPPYTFEVEFRYFGQLVQSYTREITPRAPAIVAADGGEALAFNNQIKVEFPANALPEAAEVTIRPARSGEQSLGHFPLDISAVSRLDGREIHELGAPVAITINYGQLGIQVRDEQALTLFRYDETTSSWQPLATRVDVENHTLTAWTDHFCPFDMKVQDWEAARLPGLDGFQVSSFTGAASYSYPIQVPPGPGGLQPSLVLSYNSQTVDAASSRTQASWVGMGWSLDTGYIQRNMNGTMGYLEDDTFSLVVNGVGGLLLPIAGDPDNNPSTIDYQLADQNFWRVRRYLSTGDINQPWPFSDGRTGDIGYWEVWDPSGNRYYFGNYATGDNIYGGHAWYPTYPDGCVPWNPVMETWRWSLTRARNVFNEEIIYKYSYEYGMKFTNGCGGYQENMMLAVYPNQILYPNNHYRVRFITSENRGDYESIWELEASTVLYMRSRLTDIQVEHDANADGVYETIIRKYTLGYQDGVVFPGVTWRTVGKTPTLTSITEYGLGGTNALPATTFTYDGLHLTEVQNGYGGSVNFTYEAWHAADSKADDIADWGEGNWIFPDTNNDNDHDCDDYLVDPVNVHLAEVYHPGWAYLFTVRVHAPCDGDIGPDIGILNYGIYDGYTHINASEGETKESIVEGYIFTAMLNVPRNATQALFWISNDKNLVLWDYEVRPLVTRWRVTTQTVSDDIADISYTTTYNYSGAAVNDEYTSAYVAGDPEGENLFIEPYSEFRGHSQVTVTAPDGGYTVTDFDQSDLYKGRATLVETFAYGGVRLSGTETQYFHEPTTTGVLPHPENKDPWTDLVIEWVYTTQNTSYTYDSDGTWVAKRTWYEYNPHEQGGAQYGNLTRALESQWDSQALAWRDYRLTRTLYYPNVQPSAVYLTGLAAIVKSYACPANLFNGACSTNYPSYPPESLLVGVQWYLYDNHHPPEDGYSFNTPPSAGILTGVRQLLYCENNACGTSSNQRFSDQVFTYDDWGNRTTTTAYSETGIFTAMASLDARTSAVCYGGGGIVNNDICADDGYHTYPRWERNAEGHLTTIEYLSPTFNGFALGVPVSMTDPNDITTTAGYDSFGRMTSIVRIYDDVYNPTVSVSYHEPGISGDPFYTEARQRIDGTRYFTIRKYYGGLGTLLETQVLGAELSAEAQDVVVSSWQGYALEGGQVRAVQEQSVPYAIPAGYGFRGWDYVIANSYAHSHTVLDELGRPVTVTAPDGTAAEYSYDLYPNPINSILHARITVTDAENHATVSYTDIWGRTALVDAPDGPGVDYTYDVSDRLVEVMYGSSTTVLQYDLAGRKLSMDDPDMGYWAYTYDALGNLLTQTDARGCTTSLTYDLINRLENKSYSGGCGASTAAVTYTYDQGANGVGQRTRMDYGSGSYTTWSYDARGRVEYETQVISGSGTFLTQYAYNSADLPVWMRYPANNSSGQGEMVNYTYNTQMLLDRVYGTSTYVDDTWYDAAGRVTLRELGTNYTLGQTYAYYPWTQQGGRLQSLQSGIPADQDSLQSLSYNYDAVGNVETIFDYDATSNPSDPQVQTFGYDALDRLVNAQATNGETDGRYPLQSYDYNDATGNMESNAGMSYAYTYPNAPAGVAPEHGVRQVTGGIVYNGTVTVRAKGTYGCTGWPVMKLYVNGTLRQQWTVKKTMYFNYNVTTSLTTDAQVDVVFTNACTGRTLQVDYVTIPTATGARTVQAESSGTAFDRGTETGSLGENAFDGVNVINGAELMSENGSLRFVVGLNALAAGYDANGNMTLRLKDGARYFLTYDAENRLTSVSGTVSASFAYNGDGQRVSATIGTTTTAYIGGYFEWQAGAGKSYYFAGAQRVAMRTGLGVKYLLGDHLGSTAVTALASGAFDTGTRYYPWGGVRWSSGASPTDYQFTGQQSVASIGLYFYNARFYDATMGRFTSPDTLIPDPSDPVSYDRFNYARNNPLRYVDPSGHRTCTAEEAASGDETCEQNISDEIIDDNANNNTWTVVITDPNVLVELNYAILSCLANVGRGPLADMMDWIPAIEIGYRLIDYVIELVLGKLSNSGQDAEIERIRGLRDWLERQSEADDEQGYFITIVSGGPDAGIGIRALGTDESIHLTLSPYVMTPIVDFVTEIFGPATGYTTENDFIWDFFPNI